MKKLKLMKKYKKLKKLWFLCKFVKFSFDKFWGQVNSQVLSRICKNISEKIWKSLWNLPRQFFFSSHTTFAPISNFFLFFFFFSSQIFFFSFIQVATKLFLKICRCQLIPLTNSVYIMTNLSQSSQFLLLLWCTYAQAQFI